MNIGIIGQGFVGSAIREGLKGYYNVMGFDLVADLCYNMEDVGHIDDRLPTLVNESDIIFVCVPTPMRRDGAAWHDRKAVCKISKNHVVF